MKSPLLLAAVLAAVASAPVSAQTMSFNRIASFPAHTNAPDAEESSAEIIAVTGDGMTLVYTDSPAGVLGFVDITDPSQPQAAGAMELSGEPTSVAVLGDLAYVGINTSESYTRPSGELIVVAVSSREVVARCDLGGQPDSVALAPDGSFVAVAIENERDEDLGDGRVGQLPAGFLVLQPVTGATMACGDQIRVDLTGLAEIAPEDPEPEFVTINDEGEIAVTLQENNHIVIVSRTGEVIGHFSAGSVTLEGIDTREEGALVFSDSITVPREPDAITWIDASHVAMANEGDMDGGSRGWSIFSQTGELVYDSGVSFEHAIVEIGHYPEQRSGNKGVEPESVGFGLFGETPYVFVGAERASVIGVYDVTNPVQPVLSQLLPSGIGPEGFVTIPERNLLAVANEVDDAGPRAHVMLFERQPGEPIYPHLSSAGLDPLTGWGALSGLMLAEDGSLFAVSDSFYAMQPSLFRIDVSGTPARIVEAIRLTRSGQPAQLLDLEGITGDGEGGFWVASEGRSDRLIPHAIHHVSHDGEIRRSIPLPGALLAAETRYGFEGITRVGDRLILAVQREWRDDPDHHAKVLSYDLGTNAWQVAHYPLEVPEAGWVGLSEVVAHEEHLYFIERDNQLGEAAAVKQVTRVAMADFDRAVPVGETPPVLTKEVVVDLLPFLRSTGGYVLDKVEGLAVAEDGAFWIVTDNDGVDDHSGETMLFRVAR